MFYLLGNCNVYKMYYGAYNLKVVSVSILRRTLLVYYVEGMHAKFKLNKFDQNTANDGASAKASPFHALIVLGKKRLFILTSCMTNLSEFYIAFSSSALIHLNKDAFEWHLYQPVNKFVKQN